MFDLSGKTAFITGSARGIGSAIAQGLAEAGADVVLHGTTVSPALSSAANALQTRYLTADLSDSIAVTSLANEVQALTGGVDILVLNASAQSYTGLDNFDTQEFIRQMQVNVAASFQLIQHFAPPMATRHFGRIIAISSINQIRPAPRLAVYSSTKAALANLIAMTAKAFAAEGVTANTILPGLIETERNQTALADPTFAETLRKSIPAQRFGQPEDCAGVVAFLASDAASYITGAEIPVAGGWQL